MLVLGRKYKFTSLELKRLEKIFKNNLIIRYRGRDPFEVLDEIKDILEKSNISLIVLNTKASVPNELIKYLTDLKFKKDIKLITIESFMEKYLQKCYIPEDNTDLNYLQNIKPFTSFQYFQKRVIDYLGVFSIFLISFPILIYARYKIKKESPNGSSLFKQQRIGINNKEFKCIKFRSMYIDAEKDGAKFAQKNDPRVFAWGDTMRKTRIDEIPQILNVLKGDMHLIGPRPERKIWIEKFEKEIPYYNERHIVKPGISGWAQVMYRYGENSIDAKQKLMYDLYYIKHWNIILEFKIVFLTILVILGKKGL